MNTFTNHLCLYCMLYVYLPLDSRQMKRRKPFHFHLVYDFHSTLTNMWVHSSRASTPNKVKASRVCFRTDHFSTCHQLLEILYLLRKKRKRPIFAVSMLTNMFSTLNIKILYKYSLDHVSAQIEA